ncbi:MAG: hypothetical protein CMQ40_10730 [Gammaproteobacteria bacterium]|nr:hypothetical protein [Gammaproteobacteria bacterium]
MSDALLGQQLRRMQIPPGDQELHVPSGRLGGTTVVARTTSSPNGSGSQSNVSGRKVKSVRSDGLQDWHGEQQRNPEFRGASDSFGPRVAGPGQRPAGTETWPTVAQRPISAGDYNAYWLSLTGDTNLVLDWDDLDDLDGSKRGNVLVTRLLYITIAIEHNGFEIGLPNVRWGNGGEEPDLTPVDGGVHLITFACYRFGVGAGVRTEVFGLPPLANCK